MNTPPNRLLLCLFSVLLAATVSINAQEPPPDATPPERPGMHRSSDARPGRERAPRGRMERPGHDDRGERQSNGPGMRRPHHDLPMIDRFMSHLKKNDPASYEQLTTLRKEDPEAFRSALRERLGKRRGEEELKDFPEFSEWMRKLPPERRQQLQDRLFAHGKGAGIGAQKSDPKTREKMIQLRQQIRNSAKAWHEEEDPEKRNAIKAELRRHLAEAHNQQIQSRRKQLEQFEQKLEALKKSLDELEAGKEEKLDRLVEHVLQAE